MSETYHILYPENRIVSAEKIVGWYQDAVSDGECEAIEGDPTLNVRLCALALDDAGLISLGRLQ